MNRALTETAFGNELVDGGTGYVTHAKNGFWHGPEGLQNKHVSGVLLLPQTRLWKLREENWLHRLRRTSSGKVVASDSFAIEKLVSDLHAGTKRTSLANRIASTAVAKRRYMGLPRRPDLAVGMYNSAAAL